MKKKLLCVMLAAAVSANGFDYNLNTYAEETIVKNNEDALKNALLGTDGKFNEKEELIKFYCMDYEISDYVEKAIAKGDKVIKVDADIKSVMDENSLTNESFKKAYDQGILCICNNAVSDYVLGASDVKGMDIDELSELCKRKFELSESLSLSSEELLRYVSAGLLNTSVEGAVNEEAFMNNNVIATVDGKAKIELGEVSTTADDALIEIELKNYGNTDVTYNLNDCSLYMDELNENGDEIGTKILEDGIIKFFKESVTVPAQSTVDVPVLISTPEVLNHYVSGFVVLSGDNDLSIPVSMYKGNLSERNIIDENKTYFADMYGNKLGLYTKKTSDGYEDYYSRDNVCISPDSIFGFINPIISANRNIADINVSVEGKSISYDLGELKMLGDKLPIRFDAKYYDENKGGYFDCPDGKYTFKINARSSKDDDFREYDFDVCVDSIAPEADVRIEGKSLIFKVDDNNLMNPYFTICIDGKIKKVNFISDCKNVSGEYHYTLGDVDAVECLFTDAAGNAVYKSVKTNEDAEITLCDEGTSYDLSKTNIKEINLKSYSTLNAEDVVDGKYNVKGQIIGVKPDELKIDNVDAEIIDTEDENVYEFSALVDVNKGLNSYILSIKNGDEKTDEQINGIIYGDKVGLNVEKGITNAVGVIKVSQKDYTYNVTVDSSIGLYDVYVNNERVYTGVNINDSGEKILSLSHRFNDEKVKTLNVKIVDICGNTYEDSYRIGYVKVRKKNVKVASLNQADLYYENIQTYTGKAICPEVIIVYKGITLKEGDDYTIKYENNVNIGTGRIYIDGVEFYSGTLIKKFKIFPKMTKLKSVGTKVNKKGYVKVTVKKRLGNIRYQVQYSRKRNSGFADLKKTSKTSFKTKKLLPGKTYYFRVRCYKVVDGETYCSEYSNVQKVKMQKVKTKKKTKKSKKK